MSIEIQCTTEKLIVITIKLDYSKIPSKSTVPTYVNMFTSFQDNYYANVQSRHAIYTHISFKIYFILSLGLS